MSPTTLPAPPEHGHVTFLGAGPGDPGLLTLRAVEALANADVLVAEHEVLDVVRTHARQGVAEVHTDSDTSDPGTGTPQLTVVDAPSTTVSWGVNNRRCPRDAGCGTSCHGGRAGRQAGRACGVR